MALTGSSPDGFAALAGIDSSSTTVNILLNNYQPDYDIAREIAAAAAQLINASTAAFPLIQENGLFNGEQACFNPGTQFFIPVCQTYVQATIRDNTSNAYKLVVKDLPWCQDTKWKVEIKRAGGGSVSKEVKIFEGKGYTVSVEMPFPANTVDLVSITKL